MNSCGFFVRNCPVLHGILQLLRLDFCQSNLLMKNVTANFCDPDIDKRGEVYPVKVGMFLLGVE